MDTNILNSVVDIICKITGLESVSIHADMALDSPEIGMSSLDIVTVLVQLEEKYNIQFPDSKLDMKVINNIVEIIETELLRLKTREEMVSKAFENIFGKDEWKWMHWNGQIIL